MNILLIKKFIIADVVVVLVVVVVVVVVVLVVVVVQTLSPFQAKRWPTTVCAQLNCSLHRSLLPVNSDIWGIFCPVFVPAFLERVHCSAAYNYIW